MSLRQLEVTRFSYHRQIPPPSAGEAVPLEVNVFENDRSYILESHSGGNRAWGRIWSDKVNHSCSAGSPLISTRLLFQITRLTGTASRHRYRQCGCRGIP